MTKEKSKDFDLSPPTGRACPASAGEGMGHPDITNRSDIQTLLRNFYNKAITDEIIGIFFTEVVALNLEEHIPVITDFWEGVLFNTASYKGNAMKPHFEINKLHKMDAVHFTQWLYLFTSTVDENFKGPVAEKAKFRAKSIAGIMQLKMNNINKENK